jgi:hypothetical protein
MAKSSLEIVDGPLISAGESLSDGADCTNGEIVRLTMPPNWKEANITFQISSNGEFYNDLFDRHGDEVMIPVKAGTAVVLKPTGHWVVAFAYVKIRSGTRDHPVPQPEDTKFAITLDVGASGALMPEQPTKR